MKDGLPTGDFVTGTLQATGYSHLEVVSGTTIVGTTVVSGTSITGPITGGVTATADSISKTEVSNEIPFCQSSGTQNIIQHGKSACASSKVWVAFPHGAGSYTELPDVCVTPYDVGSFMTYSVCSGTIGSFCVIGSSMDGAVANADGSFMWIAIGY